MNEQKCELKFLEMVANSEIKFILTQFICSHEQ